MGGVDHMEHEVGAGHLLQGERKASMSSWGRLRETDGVGEV